MTLTLLYGLMWGLANMASSNSNTHTRNHQTLVSNPLCSSLILDMDRSRPTRSVTKMIRLPEAGKSFFASNHIRVTEIEEIIKARVSVPRGEVEPSIWIPERSNNWLEFREIPVRDDDGFHTRTITIGLMRRDEELKEWDGVNQSQDIRISVAVVEDYDIFFLVAEMKFNVRMNSIMTDFQSVDIVNMLMMCDERVVDIQENTLRRYTRSTARAIKAAAIMVMGPPTASPSRPQIAKMTAKHLRVMSPEIISMLMINYGPNRIRVLCLCDYEARITIMEATYTAEKEELFTGYSEKVTVLTEGEEVFEWSVIDKKKKRKIVKRH